MWLKGNVLEILRSNPKLYLELTSITFQSKAFWGYPIKQMEEWKSVLTISEEYILENEVFHLKLDGKIPGYYSLVESDNLILLDNLFVHPDYIGMGYGSILLKDAIRRVVLKGYDSIRLFSDPNAEKFYEYFGFRKIGNHPTSIKNRFLPIMELTVER